MMANHCIEVICAHCGYAQCLRCVTDMQQMNLTDDEVAVITEDMNERYKLACRHCKHYSLFPLSLFAKLPKRPYSNTELKPC